MAATQRTGSPQPTGSISVREVRPEMLDELAHDDPAAIRSRGDLRRINALMLAPGLTSSLALEHMERPPGRILEVGCGDASHIARVASRLAPRWPAAELTLLDIQPVVPDATLARIEALGWRVEVVTADVFEWLGDRDGHAFDLCLANLFWHHFEGAALERLLAGLAARARLTIATEPSRDRFSLLGSRLAALIGANAVTRHDAVVSVRAGFAGDELTRAWPGGADRVAFEGRRGPFTHAFVGRGDPSVEQAAAAAPLDGASGDPT